MIISRLDEKQAKLLHVQSEKKATVARLQVVEGKDATKNVDHNKEQP